MTASVENPNVNNTRPSRRALLTGALGGLSALLAGAIGRPSSVAAEGETIHVGDEFTTASSVTKVRNQTNNENVLWGDSNGLGTGVYGSSVSGYGVSGYTAAADKGAVVGRSPAGIGVLGISLINGVAASAPANTGVAGVAPMGGVGVYGFGDPGVDGFSDNGPGVQGTSGTQIGVAGLATGGTGATFGVFGRSNSTAGAGVGGRGNANRTGVLGFSGSGSFPAALPKTGVLGVANQDSSSRGVSGSSTGGHGIHGESTSGYAGFFLGKVYTSKFHEMKEISTPQAPTSNRARLFLNDNGSGKTQLCVRFHTGAVVVIATQP